jgi:hypothetical protein
LRLCGLTFDTLWQSFSLTTLTFAIKWAGPGFS